MYIDRWGKEGEIGGYIKFPANNSNSSQITHFSQEFQQLRKDYE